ncbi:hypothetical protein [Chitinophaga nivalis]|uniref:Uncharacterized protein n=1 Tax=Chitinophaga nivalis TaxID=2991709 RepID=A0ABT3IHC3_9BACT|nr:hypothetical protein [Chitinophaga nivalis]MCW3466953.1 hypothetical protein [Chitinophaga nivalis]MCW3483356.1 hypothetical protein [Chitinophaga nivalis]
MNYQKRMEGVKAYYPFAGWREKYYGDADDVGGVEQYCPENCERAEAIADTLIAELVAAGQEAGESEKLACVENGVAAFNELAEELKGLIEWEEQEDLCELFDRISRAAGLTPQDYGTGSIADQWRTW